MRANNHSIIVEITSPDGTTTTVDGTADVEQERWTEDFMWWIKALHTTWAGYWDAPQVAINRVDMMIRDAIRGII